MVAVFEGRSTKKEQAEGLTLDELEVILKALSYYQVHLFDEISSRGKEDKEKIQRNTLA